MNKASDPLIAELNCGHQPYSESDDDINEIASKIKIIKNEKDKIISEYKKFREKYSAESKKSIEKLLK